MSVNSTPPKPEGYHFMTNNERYLPGEPLTNSHTDLGRFPALCIKLYTMLWDVSSSL